MIRRGVVTPGSGTIALLAAVGMLALWPPTASAATIDVTITGDVSMPDMQCSLREAVTASVNNNDGPNSDCDSGEAMTDTILLPAGTYPIASTTSGAGMSENLNLDGDFDLDFTSSGPLVIDGALGAGDVPLTIINGADIDRIFDVQLGGVPVLDIKEVILRNGKPPETTSHGGAILVRDDNANFELSTARVEDSHALGWGGGVSVNSDPTLPPLTDADIDITQVEFSGNDAVDDGGGLWIDGPQEFGTFNIRRSAFISNDTNQMGGGIYIRANGEVAPVEAVVELSDSTISGNTAIMTGGAIAFAFGQAGTLRMNFTTVANNTTPTAGEAGGIDLQDGEDEFIDGTGNILSGNTAMGAPANCDDNDMPPDFSPGTGIESGPIACYGGATIADPLLMPLSYNATGDQTTRTHALGASSPAIDKLGSGFCTGATDQRGIARPIGAGCDAGAFEAPAPAAGGGGGGTTTPVTPKCKKKKKKKKRSATAAKKKKGCKKKKKKKK